MTERRNLKSDSSFRNYARLEVERLPWPEQIEDPEGDEARYWRRQAEGWRYLALIFAALAAVAMIYGLGR
jgi:anti-sigma-K factor RskA